jgi:hypothetical protein
VNGGGGGGVGGGGGAKRMRRRRRRVQSKWRRRGKGIKTNTLCNTISNTP